MPDGDSSTGANEDLKAKMREALQRKQAHDHPDDSAGSASKVRGPEVASGARSRDSERPSPS